MRQEGHKKGEVDRNVYVCVHACVQMSKNRQRLNLAKVKENILCLLEPY